MTAWFTWPKASVSRHRRGTEWVRRNWPFFRDRRIDFYQNIVNRVSD